jgi:hypothetical protein
VLGGDQRAQLVGMLFQQTFRLLMTRARLSGGVARQAG